MKRTGKDIEQSARRINRRALMMGGAMVAFMSVLGLRMRYLQVEQSEKFRLLAEENRVNIRLIPPARGLIEDRRGVPIAANEQNYRVVIVREDAGDIDAVLDKLSQVITLAPEDLERIKKEVAKRSPFVPITIADRLSWDDLSAIAMNAPALPGITPEVGLSRRYPFKGDFAHVLGYVGPVSDFDLSKLDDPDPLLQIPKFQIGKVGVETKLEKDLRGSAGSKRIEVNYVGRVMRELDRIEGKSGANVTLTLDSRLQNYVQARLGDESAAAVVMDVQSGDILAINSAPSFDPNLFVRGISSADYALLTENDHRPLADKSVQGTYPPGSTFKMVVALAALEAGEVTPESSVSCRGFIELSGRKAHCWKRSGHGKVDLRKSLMQSCDVFYYEMAQRVGVEKITAMAKRLGLGVKHDLPMSAVAAGLTPTKQWKLETQKADWVIGDTLNAGIGQGYVLASPLQLAVMVSRVATGRNILPRLVKAIDGSEQPILGGESLGLDPAHLASVRAGMTAVVNDEHGTAYGSRVIEETARMAGKTGTSQVRNISTAERERGVSKNDDLPWEKRDHALFVAFAPAERPRLAVALIVEHGGGGSAAAAPIVRDIMLQALHEGFPPLSAYPQSQRQRIENERKELLITTPEQPSATPSRA